MKLTTNLQRMWFSRQAIQVTIILLIFFFVACSSGSYHPKDLRKLTESEMIERARGKKFWHPDSIVFKDTTGNILSKEEVEKLDQNEFFGDQYVNDNQKIAEVVIRRSTDADRALLRKLEEAFEEGEPITLMDVNCDEVTSMLDKVFEDDQQNRSEGTVENMDIDRINQQKVVSIIEKCGFPTVQKHGSRSVQSAFLVLQHAGRRLREKYFPLIKKSAEKGDLKQSWVALMEDRMLMDRGEKQKYGSQVHKGPGDKEWKLWPIEDAANVNKRRADAGLNPIEEYLKEFNIEYKSEK